MIQIRATNNDSISPLARAEFIKIWMIEKKLKGTILVIPNVEGIYWGRNVGYKLKQIDVDTKIKKISATKIRKGINDSNDKWQKNISSKKVSNLLNPATSRIVETGLVVWLTGCPSAGKTTIGNLLNKKIKKHFPLLKTQLLDGDVMRSSPISRNTGFSPTDRSTHIRKMGYLCKLFADHGILVIASFISPSEKIRRINKKLIGRKRYLEVYVKASKKKRIKRDAKGLYKKAASGQITNLTGFNAPYDKPINPDITCNTDLESKADSVNKVFNRIFK